MNTISTTHFGRHFVACKRKMELLSTFRLGEEKLSKPLSEEEV